MTPIKAVLSATSLMALTAPAFAQEVNLYSSRHYDSDDALYAAFTEKTGIEINRIEAKADELMARMEAEGANSPADVFMTVDVGRISRAEERGLLQPFDSDVIEANVPAHLRDDEQPLDRPVAARADHLLLQGACRHPAAQLRGPRRPGL